MCWMRYTPLYGDKQFQTSAVLLLSLNSEFPTANEANPAEDETWGTWVAITVGFGVLVGWGFSEVLQVGLTLNTVKA